MSKEGLQKVIQHEQSDSLAAQVLLFFDYLNLQAWNFLLHMLGIEKLQLQGNFLSTEDLRDLFTFHENVR